MTIQIRDSFESGASATTLGYTCSGAATETTGGRWGGGCLDMHGGNDWAWRPLPTARAKLGVHFSFTQPASSPWDVNIYEDNVIHINIGVNANGYLQFYRGGVNNAMSAIGSQGTTPIALNTWYHVEVWIELADTPNGVLQAYVNGNPTAEIDESGISTLNTNTPGSGVCTRIYFDSHFSGSAVKFNDVVVYDDQGSYNNTAPLGDLRVQNLIASGNGASSQWVGLDADSTDNYAQVDDNPPPDGDTSYVESSTVGNKDTYAMSNLSSTTGTVLAVGANLYAKKTDAGTRSIKPVYRLAGGTEADGTEMFLGTTYQAFEDIAETKPGGGTWSIADVNGMELGQKVAS